ncbi:MAG: FAD:protein FMN transferase [Steroidobacteraceae bacterium]
MPSQQPLRLLIPAQLSAAALQGAIANAQVHVLQGTSMGTQWTVKAVGPQGALPASWRAGIEHELQRVVAQMSNWDVSSDLCRYNIAPAGSWVALPAECLEVVGTALVIAAESGGAFDPTAGALVNCWGFGPAPRRTVPPDALEIARALRRVGWSRIAMHAERRSLWQPGGVTLDLCAIAKGFAVDQIACWLEQQGVAHYLIEVGGELRGQGCKPDGLPWWVEMEMPSPGGLPGTRIALEGLAVATSGDYRRGFEHEGERFAHTLDPRTGCPVQHAMASVSVVHASCMHADALATAITVLGPQAGFDWAERRGIAARLILRTPRGLMERCTSELLALAS